MKKIALSLISFIIIPLSGLAQQIPNSNFDGNWSDFKPYWENAKTNWSAEPKVVGLAPNPWKFSNLVISNQDKYKLILGEKSKSKYGIVGNSVCLTNKNFTDLSSRVEPAYISLGTPWSGSSNLRTQPNKDRDFGSRGGYGFIFRPDAISFVYKTEKNKDQPTLILYTFSNTNGSTITGGNWAMTNVPMDIKVDGTTYFRTATFTYRDCCILGLEPFQGVKADSYKEGVRFCKLMKRLPFADDWTVKKYDIPYDVPYDDSDAQPKYINIIFSAGEYYTLNQKLGATLHLDNVKLIYYSRLASLNINGMPVELQDGVYEYSVPAGMPASESEIQAECMGDSNSGKTNIKLFPEDNKAEIEVTNRNSDVTGANKDEVMDEDGLNSHKYTLLFSRSSAITDIEAAKEEENVRYFDLRGIEVDKSSLTPGIYIRRTGSTSTKVVIK